MVGKRILDLPPSEENKRNSEGSFIKLKNGDIMFAYTRYRGAGCHDHDTADIYAMISKDEGETFSEPFLFLGCSDVNADNIMSVSFLRMKNGDMGLFYCKKTRVEGNKWDCTPYLSLSSDDGKTWSKHIRCISESGYYVLCNDKVIYLDSGRILMPISYHRHVEGAGSPGVVYMYASDDEGMTWYKIAENIELVPGEREKNKLEGKSPYSSTTLEEPGVAQLADGTVWCYVRTKYGVQYETFSKDRGETWSAINPSEFSSPQSPMTVRKLKCGNFIAVWNPIPGYDENINYGDDVVVQRRTPFAFAVLNEMGEFTSEYKVFETDETVGYCYPAIFETDSGDILTAYCAGGVEDKSCLNRLRIRKIYKSELN